VSCGNPQAAAQFDDRRAIPQVAANHPRLGPFVRPPEHLGPHYWGEIIAPNIEPQPLMTYALAGDSTNDAPGGRACHDLGYSKLKRGRGPQIIGEQWPIISAGHRRQYA
jgi:hypothetical protein